MSGKRKETKEGAHVRRRRQDVSIADWGGASAELIRRAIETITSDGGAVRFGYSRDGGAYSLGVYGDGKPFTEFLPGAQDVDEWLAGFIVDYE